MKTKLQLLTKTLLLAAGLMFAIGANAYDTPSGYQVGTVYLGQEVNNQVLAETFANCTNGTDLTSLSTNWSTNVSGTAGYYWAKIASTVNVVAYPATDKATISTCNKYSATNDGGTTTTTVYSNNDGATYYTSNDFQTVFDATGYTVTSDGTAYQIPSYVYGKCISVQHRNKSEFYLDYTLPTEVSTGKLVFGADFYRIQNVTAPLYIQFYDSSDNLVFQWGYDNGSGARTGYHKVGTDEAVAGAGYSDYRTYHGWGIKDVVFDFTAGTVSYTIDNIHSDSKTNPNRRSASRSDISIGTGKNIKKVRFSTSLSVSSANCDFFIDNMYLYTLVSGTATTSDMTFIGTKDYEDGYLASNSSDYVIKPNGKLHLKFKNYGSGAYNWNNWVALFNNADKSSNLAYIRADAWDLASWSNTGITTSDNYWSDFQSDMYGAAVEMDITRTDGNVKMVATITTTASKEMTLTFDKAIGTASEDIVFRLSEEAACLVIDNTKSAVVAPPTFSQTGITNVGNPIITLSENALAGNTTASYYTIDGGTPTTSSTAYTDPVTVTGGNTIKAITIATASDGTTTLTSNVGTLTTTEYIAAQTYDLSATDVAAIQAEGFTSSPTNANYGVGSTTRYGIASKVGSEGKIILGGLSISGNSDGTWYYWMSGQGLWQSGGTRSATVTSIQDGEVALFTEYDCSYDGSAWTSTEVESYKSDCSYSLSKSNNAYTSGNHVHMLKTIQTFVPAGSTVSKTISSAGWSTYCSPYILDFTSSIDNLDAAYIVTGGSDGVLTKTQVTGAVPAGTGLLLKGSASKSVSIPVAATATFDVDDNKLVGVTASETLAANGGYVLMTSGSNGLAFYKNSNNFTLSANSAYLPANFDGASARSAFLLFGDESTGIDTVNSEELKVKSFYNLSGQRVAAPQKGLYIVNGKKVVLK